MAKVVALCLISNLRGALLDTAGLPDAADALGQADIVSLELVPAPANDEDGQEVGPLGDAARDGHAPFGKVVGDD